MSSEFVEDVLFEKALRFLYERSLALNDIQADIVIAKKSSSSDRVQGTFIDLTGQRRMQKITSVKSVKNVCYGKAD